MLQFMWRLIASLIQNTNSSAREYCRFPLPRQNILVFRIATLFKNVQNKCVPTTKNTSFLPFIFGQLFKPINHFVGRTMYISPVPPSCTRTRHTQRISWSLLLNIYTSILYIHVCISTYVYMYIYIYIYICKLYLPFRFFPQREIFGKGSSEKNQISSKKKCWKETQHSREPTYCLASTKDLTFSQSMDCTSPVALHFYVIAICRILKIH